MLTRALLCASLMTLVACASGPSGRPDDASPLKAVSQVDTQRYLGKWYEIARYPNSFQKNCEGVTAEYTLRDDGRIGVTNTCAFGTSSGRSKIAMGKASVIDGSNGARLAVNFAPIPLPKGDGNYWVLYLDDAYQHALIGEPSGRYLWMLARTPQITPQARDALDAAARSAGYDLSMLKETQQK
jgi:apolipoprotein D and lipocalin family protein